MGTFLRLVLCAALASMVAACGGGVNLGADGEYTSITLHPRAGETLAASLTANTAAARITVGTWGLDNSTLSDVVITVCPRTEPSGRASADTNRKPLDHSCMRQLRIASGSK